MATTAIKIKREGIISDMDSKPRWLGKRSRVRLGQHSREEYLEERGEAGGAKL